MPTTLLLCLPDLKTYQHLWHEYVANQTLQLHHDAINRIKWRVACNMNDHSTKYIALLVPSIEKIKFVFSRKALKI